MSSQDNSGVKFISRMNEHSDSLNKLSKAFDKAVEAFGSLNLAQAITKTKVLMKQ